MASYWRAITTSESTPPDGPSPTFDDNSRTTRHRGYRQSQKRRKIVEQVFGWMKTVGGGRKLRFVGRERNRCWLELTAAAYNLVRMATLETAAA